MKFRFLRKLSQYIFGLFSKWQIKLIFGIGAFLIVILIILFTQSIVTQLIEREQKIISLYADMYESYFFLNVENEDVDYENTPAFSDRILIFFIENITPTISFPVIMTDPEDVPLKPYESWTLNIDIKESMSEEERDNFLVEYTQKMKKSYPPFLVKDQDGNVVQKLYYTHSVIVDVLTYFPILALVMISTFVFIGYIAFSNSRKNEQSKVWVGMAKEAAHQLGTPLSSLMAWLEIIKYSKEDPQQIEDTSNEMQKDVSRLNVIATRFSKIGSEPEMEKTNLSSQIDGVISYFERRLPHLGKRIEIQKILDNRINAEINPELFNWVFENLLKNAAEAIEEKHGLVSIELHKMEDNKIRILVSDNGKGMTKKMKRQIFYPGFTTKKRGWGLGLSLTKRIIEEYHKGKIYVKDSQIGKGTTFSIELNENLEQRS